MMPTKKNEMTIGGILSIMVAAVFLFFPCGKMVLADEIIFDFDNSPEDQYFSTGKEFGTSFDWTVGEPSVGDDCYAGGDTVYATNPTGEVTDEQCAWIQTPPIGLGGGQNVELIMNHCFQLEDLTDAANVWLSCIATMADNNVSPADFFQGTNKYQLDFDDYTTVASSNPCPWLNGHPSWGASAKGFTMNSPGHGGTSFTNDSAMLTLADNPYGTDWSNDNMVCIFRFVYGQLEKTPSKRAGASGWYFLGDKIDRGEPTAVVLLYFEATGLNGRVVVDWETASEHQTIGFNLYRSLDESGPFTEQINGTIIPAIGSSMFGASYSFNDEDVINGVPYYYILEEVDYQGYTTQYGPVAASPDVDGPTLVSPAEGAVIPVEAPGTFEWNGAYFSQFKLQLSVDPDFPIDSRISVPENGTWTSEEVVTLLAEKWDEILLMALTGGSDRIYWRVAARDDLDEIFFSDTRSFTLSILESKAEEPTDSIWKRLLLMIVQ